jgi:uncharacterized membrane protein
MVVAALALAGIFISLYLTLFKLGVIGELTCSIGSCETVNTSKWSTFLHLPVAAWGLLFYAEVFVISVLGTMPRFENELFVSLISSWPSSTRSAFGASPQQRSSSRYCWSVSRI